MSPLSRYSVSNLPYEGINLVIARIIRRVLIFLPIPLIGIASIILFNSNPSKATVILSLIPIVFIFLIVLYKGHLRTAVLSFSISLNLLITHACVFGNGIHDIAIMVFPLVILFTCLMLRLQDLWLIAIFTTICLSFIVIGERTGLYIAIPAVPGRISDVLILSFVLVGGLITISSIAAKLKSATKQAIEEIGNQELISENIQQTLTEKHELFREVHHRVKNHLAFINSLIDMETMTNPNVDRKKIKELQSRIVAVARVHDQLYHADNYESVGTKNYLESIISQFMMTYKMVETQTDLKIDDFMLPVGNVIYLGISIHEIISLISVYSGTSKKIEFILSKGTKQVHLTIIFDHHSNQRITDQTEKMELLKFLASKLNGVFEIVSGERKALIEFDFPLG